MKIAILSDTHDHILNLRAAVTFCNSYGVRMIIHCGDLISPFMLDELARFGGAVHLIYGNNAGDQHLISSWCGVRFPSVTHHGVLGAVEAGGRKIAFTHYPEMARGLASQGMFDAVCCGHNHRYHVEKIGKTLLINPGELLGKDGQPGFGILACSSMEVERVDIGLQIEGC
ncbi:MAG: YfcE family phosphodiesterase [Proteobacteria bacterium]|nr:YfcE family phosphodiesterase [Pseudomonadota bacterium]MBU1710389.1 YfcE family phosphodiesterase [Pseudomonadota bacterium]